MEYGSNDFTLNVASILYSALLRNIQLAKTNEIINILHEKLNGMSRLVREGHDLHDLIVMIYKVIHNLFMKLIKIWNFMG